MKKLMVIFVLAAAITSLLTGCAPAEPKTYSDPAQAIEVKVGQEFIIALDENPSTGYVWQAEFASSFLKLVEDEYEPSTEGLIGAGGTHRFLFQALDKGKIEITMVSTRMGDEAMGEEKVFTVNVK
jgi:predicted secreted protein